ncbi:MAG: CBS domain-containing protein [Planctomycetota bacterium]
MSLGRMKVADLIGPEVAVAKLDEPLREAARRMTVRRISCLPVVEEGRLRGIVTLSDFGSFAAGEDPAAERTVADIMSPAVVCVAPDTPVDAAARRMVDHRVHHLVVAEGESPIGVLSSFDLVRALIQVADVYDSLSDAY